jgi:pimeloyl-ACP methyl ester carboxylesterase
MALIVAVTRPDTLSSVTLFGFTPDVSYDIAPVPVAGPAPRTRNTAAAAASDFIAPSVTPPAVVRAFVAAALAADPIFAEWKNDHELNAMAANRLTVPVLLMHGEKDPGTSTEDAGRFLAAVASHAKSYVVLPLADHCAQLEDTHDAFISAVTEFITRPAPRR